MARQTIDPQTRAQNDLDIATRKLTAAEVKATRLRAEHEDAVAAVGVLEQEVAYLAANPKLRPASATATPMAFVTAGGVEIADDSALRVAEVTAPETPAAPSAVQTAKDAAKAKAAAKVAADKAANPTS